MKYTGNSAGRIDLTGNGDFIKIVGDSVKGRLAYFGEVRIVRSLHFKDSGVNFDGVPYCYELRESEKKQFLELKFNINLKTSPQGKGILPSGSQVNF